MVNQNIKKIILRIENLEKAVFNKNAKKEKVKLLKNDKINFKLNLKAFIKRYAVKMSGPKKFTLILAYLVEGKVGKEIDIKCIKEKWYKKLGTLNDSYTNFAQSRGWVNSKSRGIYCLTNEWKNIF